MTKFRISKNPTAAAGHASGLSPDTPPLSRAPGLRGQAKRLSYVAAGGAEVPAFCNFGILKFLVFWGFGLLFVGICAAQTAAPAPQTAVISGRVFNLATGLYLHNAEVRLAGAETYVLTDEDGSYRIEVPAGAVTLAASYASAQTATATLAAAAGADNIQNFDLQPIALDAAAGTGVSENIVHLDRFDVTSERDGQAKAIMDQRAAPNAVTLISADNFGDITMDSIGEVVKYLPGITVDQNENDAGGVRIGALGTAYTTVSQDGVALQTSGRSVTLEPLTATGIETIALIHTLTAGMDAGSAAGRLDLRTKDPFSRKHRQVRFTLGLNGHSTGMAWGGDIMPDGRKHALLNPGGQLNYGDIFLGKRLAIEFNLARYASFSRIDRQVTEYSYRNPDPVINPGIDFATAAPVITKLSWRPRLLLRDTWSGNLNLGFKITDHLKLTLRGSFRREETEIFSLTSSLNAYYSYGAGIVNSPTTSVQPKSTLVNWIVSRTDNANARLFNDYAHIVHNGDTKFLIPRLSWKNQVGAGTLSIDLYGGYSRYTGRQRDAEKGFFYSANSYLSRIGWTATRPSTDSPAWTIKQTGGDDWSIPENWSKINYYHNGIRSYTIRNNNTQYSGALDIAYARRVLGHPFTFKTGGVIKKLDYTYRTADARYNYTGPQNRPQEAPIPCVENYTNDFTLGGRAGNIAAQKWRVDDTYALYQTYLEHPDWFRADTVENYRRALTSARELHERIDAAYLETNTRYGRLRLNAGLRAERTDTESQYLRRRSAAELEAEGLSADTIEGIAFLYHNGRRFARRNAYTNLFLSGGAKYDLTQNLQAQLSASQSIRRPDYSNLAGVVTYDEDSLFVTIPNPLLKPERLSKYYLGLNYLFKPAGTLNLSVYRIDIKNKQLSNVEITRGEAEAIAGMPLSAGAGAGAGDDPEDATDTAFDSYTYRTTINSENLLSSYAATIAYDQQLTFLPGALRGLGAFATFTIGHLSGAHVSLERIGQIKRSINGGLRYRAGRVSLVLRGVWNDRTLVGVTNPTAGYYYFWRDHEYAKARLTLDASANIRLIGGYTLGISARNILNEPYQTYSNVPGRLRRYDVGGATLSINLGGVF
jgi:TonB-dependent receptor